MRSKRELKRERERERMPFRFQAQAQPQAQLFVHKNLNIWIRSKSPVLRSITGSSLSVGLWNFPDAKDPMEVNTAEHLPCEPSVNTPDAKHQMEIDSDSGVSVRATYKAMRKRVRIEARRQKELEEGRAPEVLLETFLQLLKHKLHPVLEHRRAKDKRQRETLCWWIAKGKECFNGAQCTFKHVVPEVKGKTASRTGASRPGPATE